MRTALQIKQELERLRFDRRHQIPLAKIAQDSRCNQRQITEAMKLTASETVLRRLDAYLDAGHLHKIERSSRMLSAIEWLKREMWREYGAQSIPMEDVMRLTTERQKRLLLAMNWRAKRLLSAKVQKEANSTTYFSDGSTYWRCKAQIVASGKVNFKNGNIAHRKGQNPVAQRRLVQPRAYQKR